MDFINANNTNIVYVEIAELVSRVDGSIANSNLELHDSIDNALKYYINTYSGRENIAYRRTGRLKIIYEYDNVPSDEKALYKKVISKEGIIKVLDFLVNKKNKMDDRKYHKKNIKAYNKVRGMITPLKEVVADIEKEQIAADKMGRAAPEPETKQAVSERGIGMSENEGTRKAHESPRSTSKIAVIVIALTAHIIYRSIKKYMQGRAARPNMNVKAKA